MTNGSKYIHENIVSNKEYKNVFELVIDIYNHFDKLGGTCEWNFFTLWINLRNTLVY